MTLVHALNETLKQEFRHNPDTYIWGQDVAYREKGGVFNVTKGMQQEFGPARVFNAPIAEDHIMGTADGFSRLDERIRVVVEGAEFADYFWPAAEQMIEMSHEYWRTKGQFVPNVTVRLPSGGYIGGGLYHSQNLEGWLATLPGIRIVVPAFADDAAGLLRTAIRSRGITLYLEPKFLYNNPMAKAKVPAEFAVPFGKARVRREGTELTIVAYGTPVHFALEARKALEAEGRSIEVIDLRSLVPLDWDTVLASVRKTNRVLVAHEDKVHGGFGGEIAAQIQERAFESLDAPVGRVGSEFTPVGFSRILERAILPSSRQGPRGGAEGAGLLTREASDSLLALRRVEDLTREQQKTHIPQDHELHVLEPLGVGLLDLGRAEAAAVDGLAARQVDPERDDEDDQEDPEDARRRPPRDAQEEPHPGDDLEPRKDEGHRVHELARHEAVVVDLVGEPRRIGDLRDAREDEERREHELHADGEPLRGQASPHGSLPFVTGRPRLIQSGYPSL